ncbi:hypothetical protein NBRC116494_14130 [Aurantivibrio plasticivorans]
MTISSYRYVAGALLATIALSLFGVTHKAHSQNDNKDGWEHVTEEYSVRLYYRPYPQSKIPEFKAITTVQSSMASIIAVLLDSEACALWVHQCKESFPLHIVNDAEQIVYQVNDLPLAKDRDIILLARMEVADDTHSVKIFLKAASDYCSKANPGCEKIDHNKYIHVVDSHGFYLLEQESQNQVKVTWQHYVDPAGKLPDWLARSQLKNLPLKTLHQLRNIVKEDKYQRTTLTFSDGIVRLEHQ